jgi:hypothetical protein
MKKPKRENKPTRNARAKTSKGPEPERLKISGVADWEDAVGIAMQKKRPPEGWPK